MIRDDAGRFHDAFFLGANHQPQELSHAPGQRRCTACAAAKDKAGARRLGLFPHLLRDHAALICEMQHGVQIRRRIVPRRNLILAAFSSENWPEASDSLPLPRSAKISLAVAVVAVAVKRWAVRRFHANSAV